MTKNHTLKKGLSILLCVLMLLQNVPMMAFAADTVAECIHHTDHTTECGYVPTVPGVDCTHVHDTACGYAEAVAEVLCPCTDTDENGALVHTEGCGYIAPVAGVDCTHVHDELCSYVAAVEGADCTFHCDICCTDDHTEEPEATDEPIVSEEPAPTEAPAETPAPSPELTPAPTPEVVAEPETAQVQVTCKPNVALPDHSELFSCYADQKLYGYEWTTFGTQARATLNPIEQSVYDILKAKVEAIAASGGSTEFSVSAASITGLKTTFTNAELGVGSITADNVQGLLGAAMDAQLNFNNVLSALLTDCPFDLYWFDKTVGAGMYYGISYYSYEASIPSVSFVFYVSPHYYGSETSVTTDVSKIAAVKANAQAVVTANAGKSDYEKLVAYMEYICNAVSYNSAAADDSYSGGYGNPWQLIYVFDGDSSTNVVCEGYAKAFQYLCDLGSVDCINVSGTMTGATGAGNHMWNVVTLGGKNYLVDVTNCDAGTVGSPDKLFLRGATYADGGYTITIGSQDIVYTCSNHNLAAEDYSVSAPAVTYSVTVNAAVNGTVTADKSAAKEGETVIITIAPADGYFLSKLTYQSGTDVVDLMPNLDDLSKYSSFTMPAADVTVTAEFKCAHPSAFIKNNFCSNCESTLVAKVNSTYVSSAEELNDYLAASEDKRTVELLGEWDTFAPTFNNNATVTLSGSVKHITVNSERSVYLTLQTSSVESIALEQGDLILTVADFTNLHKLDLTATGDNAYLTVILSDSNYGLYRTESGEELSTNTPLSSGNCFIHSKNFGTPNAHNWSTNGTAKDYIHTFTCSECGAIRTVAYSREIDFCDICFKSRPHNIVISDAITNGTVTADKAAASLGETVTLTVTPDSGYLQSYLEVYYTDNSGGADEASLAADYTVTLTPVEGQTGKYTFVMPAAEVNVVASFSKCDHKDSKHTTAESKNNGKHIITCTVCKEPYDEFCTFNSEYKCILCGYDCGHLNGRMITVEATCVATGTKTNVCNACEKIISQTILPVDPENHGEMDSSTGLCSYGCGTSLAVVSATVGGTTTYYSTLSAALEAVSSAAAADNATVRLLKDVELAQRTTLSTGVFTLDLNGKTLDITNYYYSLEINGSDVTVTSSVAGGKIYSETIKPIDVLSGKLTVASNVTVHSDYQAYGAIGTILISGGTVTLDGGTVTASNHSPIYVEGGSFIMNAGTIEHTYRPAVEMYSGTVTLAGGTLRTQASDTISVNGGTLNIGAAAITHESSAKDIGFFCAASGTPAVLDFTNATGTEYTVKMGYSTATPLPVANLIYDSDKHSLSSTDSNLTDGSFEANSVATLSCAHPNATTTPNNDGTHTISCSACGYTGADGHEYSYSADEEQNTITHVCEICGGDSVTFTLVIPTSAVYGSALEVPHYDCTDKTYNGDAPVITLDGMLLKDFVPAAETYEAVMTWGGKTVSGEYTIAKGTPTVTVPTNLTASYGDSLADVALNPSAGDTAGTWAWNDAATTSVGNAGSNTFKATFTPTDTANYKTVEVTLTIAVAKAAPVVTAPAAASDLVYTGDALVLVSGGSTTGGTLQYKVNDGQWSASLPTAIDAGTYTVSYQVAGDENYEDTAEQSITVTITAASLETATVTLDEDTFTYDGKPHTPTVTVTLNGKTLTEGKDYTVTYQLARKIENGKPTLWFGDHTTSEPCIDAANNYYAVVVGMGNYYTKDLFTLYENFVIEQAPLTIKADDQMVIVNGAINSNCFSITDGALADGHTLTATVSFSIYTEDNPMLATPGTYEDVLFIDEVSVRIMDGEEEVTANYSRTYETGTLYVVQHMHEFTYTPDDTTDTITAICANTDGFCPDTEQSVTLAAEGKTYDGKPVIATVTGAVDGYTPAATYCCADGCTSVGTHTASVQLGVAKVTVSFEITIPEAVLSPAAPNGNNGWYTVATLTAPDGYQISTIKDGTFGTDISLNDGEHSSYTYWLMPEANSSAQPVEMTAELGIKVDGTLPTVTKAEPTNVTDSSATITVTAEDATSGIAKHKVTGPTSVFIAQSNDNVFVVSGMFPNRTYSFTVVTYDNAGNVSASQLVSVTTLKAASSVTAAPTPKELTYDGSEQELIFAGEASGGTMGYSLTQDGTYTDVLPTATTADTYTVWYKVLGDNYHFDTEPQSITVTIAKADDYIGTVSAAEVSDTLELSAVTLTRTDSTVAGTLTVDANQTLKIGSNTLTYTFTPDDTTNYEVLTGTVAVNVVDTVSPIATLTMGSNSWSDLVSPVTFDLFSNAAQTVNVAASDDFSGVDTIKYYIASEEMTLDALKALSDGSWTELVNSSEITIPAADGTQAVCYVRVTDQGGNVTYAGTNGMVFDLTVPVISGVEDGITYYTTQTATAADDNLLTVTVNGIAASPITLEGNRDAEYIITATDKAGNETTVIVTMKPIAELAKPMEDLTESNVTSDDEPTLKDIIDTVDELLEDENLPADEKKALNDIKDDAEDLLDAVNDAQNAVDTDAVNDTLDITSENVETEDKEALEQAKEDLEQALEDYGDNYTDEEIEIIEDAIDRIEDALDSIEAVEEVEELIDALPDKAEADDTDTRDKVLDVKEAYDQLTDHEKDMVDDAAEKKLKDLSAAVAYKIVKGNGSKWTVGSDKDLSFTANGAYSRFEALEIDGKVINTKYYEAKDGSTIITLKNEYLDGLKTGKHTIAVVYSDGEASGTFTVTVNPATGDNSNVGLWAGLFGFSAVALVITLVMLRRKRDEK